MKVHYLFELSKQPISSLKEILSDDFKEITEELFRRGIYKEEKSNYTIEYVGIISFNKIILAILPKFFLSPYKTNDLKIDDLKIDNATKEQELKLIMQVLKIHAKKSQSINDNLIYAGSLNDNENTTNRLALIDDILSDYIQNGLYKTNKQLEEINGDGQINWTTTIDQEQAHIINDTPIYLNLHTDYMISDNDHYITRLHKYILIKAKEELKTFPIQTILTDLIHTPNFDFTYDTDHFINKDIMTNAIDKELQDVLHERKTILLKNMKLFINEQEHHSEKALKLWGIRKFWSVWESICKHIFNDQSDVYNSKIPCPRYNQHETAKTLIPDIVIKQQKNILIVDAKYYNFTFDENGKPIGNPPQLESILKQFAYALAFDSLRNPTVKKYNYENIYNFFCIPTYTTTQDKIPKIIGTLHFDIFPTQSPIKIISIPHHYALHLYTNSLHLSQDFYKELFSQEI